jgi:hypothetical protein
MRHKHADLIIAWANGADIEYFNGINHEWRTFVKDHNVWYEDWKYRIKPEPKPDLVCWARIIPCVVYPGTVLLSLESANVEFTFDGETEELKSAKVIK